MKPFLLSIGAAAGLSAGMGVAQDMPLSKVLKPGQGWELVAEGFSFTDAPAVDQAGRVYFTGASDDGDHVYRVDESGRAVVWFKTDRFASGGQFGPDGRLYQCRIRDNQIVAIDAEGRESVIASVEKPNDLAVSRSGHIYCTQTPLQQVTHIRPDGSVSVADVGIEKPNGVALSPDQGTLAVSDYSGRHVWAFRVGPDGALSAKQPYMTMRMPSGGGPSRGDGMTTDESGRYYVTTALGIQMFDPTGRISGVIPKPQRKKGVTNLVFGGPKRSALYATAGDKVYRRETLAVGSVSFD